MGNRFLWEYLEEVEVEEEYAGYDGYYYSVAEAIIIIVVGSLCGLRNTKQIWLWATNDKIQEFLKEKFQIRRVPSYYWLLCLLKMVKPESMSKCFSAWISSMLPEEKAETIAVDGKTIRSTKKMKKCSTPLHIVSAQLGELGLTYAQETVDDKSNEIPAVQKLLEELDISGCIVVADALNCQKKTAQAVIEGKGDYLLSVKDNQAALETDIADYVQDPDLRKNMGTNVQKEKNRGRIETRTAFVTGDIGWIPDRQAWPGLCCVGSIHTEFEEKGKKTSEWHYYISSRDLTALELLHHARMEWAVESMHWILDVHFSEDFCRIVNRTIQQNLNMLRKFALTLIKQFKTASNSKRPLSQIMFNCLLDPSVISHMGNAHKEVLPIGSATA